MARNINKCRRIVASLSASGGCSRSGLCWMLSGTMLQTFPEVCLSTFSFQNFWGSCIDGDVLISAASPALCNAKHLLFTFSLTWIASLFFPHDHLSGFLTLCASSGITKQSKYFFTRSSAFNCILLPSKADFGMYLYVIIFL